MEDDCKPAYGLAFAPGARRILALSTYDPEGPGDGAGSEPRWRLRIWDVERETIVHEHLIDKTSEDFTHNPTALIDGRQALLAVGRSLQLINLESGSVVHTFFGHQHRITSLAVSPDGRAVISGSIDHTVGVWDVETGATMVEFREHG